MICYLSFNILLTKTIAAHNDVALSYHRVRGLYFLAVVFVAAMQTSGISIYYMITSLNSQNLRNIIKKVAKISIIQILMSNLSVKATV